MIPSAFHPEYDPGREGEQAPSVPRLAMHEFLDEIAGFIDENCSSEEIELLQPAVLRRIAAVLRKRHEEGRSLETDYGRTQVADIFAGQRVVFAPGPLGCLDDYSATRIKPGQAGVVECVMTDPDVVTVRFDGCDFSTNADAECLRAATK